MPEATPEDFELARTALLEITPAETIGVPAGFVDEGDGTVSVYFDADMLGYPGWRWTVSIAHVEGAEPTVLETELMPGDTSLLAPEWIPWVDRLADYRAAQEAAGAAAAELEASEEVDDEDLDDDDDEDDDDVLHAGDLDGVDIDTLDDDDDDDDESDDDDDDDDSDDDDDDDELDDDSDDSVDDDAEDAKSGDSAVAAVGVDESEQAETDADGAGEKPPAVVARDERSEKEQ